VPARIISGVTRSARVRRDITSDLRFDGTILRRRRFAAKIMKRNQSQAACTRYRCDNQWPMTPGSRQLWHNFSCNVMEIETQRQICIRRGSKYTSLPILSPRLLFERNATRSFFECLEALRVLLVIFLVVRFGWMKFHRWQNFGYDRFVEFS